MKAINKREDKNRQDKWFGELSYLNAELSSNLKKVGVTIRNGEGDNNGVFTTDVNAKITPMINSVINSEPYNPTERKRPNPFSRDPLDIAKRIDKLHGFLKKNKRETLDANSVNKIINYIYKLSGYFYGKEFKETRDQLTEILQILHKSARKLRFERKISAEEKREIEKRLERIDEEQTKNKSNPIHEHPENLGYN